MKRIIITILLIAGMITFLNCENIFNNNEKRATIPEWYPSIVSNYEPYELRPFSELNLELNPGQKEFTEAEIGSYAREFIDQRKELIGADSKSLRLVRVTKVRNDPQRWHLSYQQIYSYNFKVVVSRYGSVEFSSSDGKVTSLSSTVIPVVPVPNKQIVSSYSIRESIIGEKIIFYYPSGNPVEVEVRENDKIIFRDLIVFPILRENTLEVRLCCEIEVVVNGLSWSFFYDVINGEKISLRQNFRF